MKPTCEVKIDDVRAPRSVLLIARTTLLSRAATHCTCCSAGSTNILDTQGKEAVDALYNDTDA